MLLVFLGVVIYIIIMFFIVKIAVRSAIIEARRMTNVTDEIYMRKQIKAAIVEALQERENKNNGV